MIVDHQELWAHISVVTERSRTDMAKVDDKETQPTFIYRPAVIDHCRANLTPIEPTFALSAASPSLRLFANYLLLLAMPNTLPVWRHHTTPNQNRHQRSRLVSGPGHPSKALGFHDTDRRQQADRRPRSLTSCSEEKRIGCNFQRTPRWKLAAPLSWATSCNRIRSHPILQNGWQGQRLPGMGQRIRSQWNGFFLWESWLAWRHQNHATACLLPREELYLRWEGRSVPTRAADMLSQVGSLTKSN